MWTLSTILLTAVTGIGVMASSGAHGAPARPPTVTPSTPDKSPYPPGPPGDLTVVAVTSRSVTLSWTASTPGCCGIEGYNVTRQQLYHDVLTNVDVGNVTTVTFTDLQPTTGYRYAVAARDTIGRPSLFSNSVTVVTPVADSGPDLVPPAAPTALTATDATAHTVVLTWSPSTDNVGVTGYDVYLFDGVYLSTRLATVAGTTYTAPLTSSRNRFYVRARDAAGNLSASSNMVTVTSTSPTGGTSGPPSGGPSSPHPGSLQCRVTYTAVAQWDRGFVSAVAIANTGPTAINGWQLAFTFGGDQQTTQSWNATASQVGSAVTVANAHWNGTIAAGASASFGLLGRWSTGSARPSSFTLNGIPCAVG